MSIGEQKRMRGKQPQNVLYAELNLLAQLFEFVAKLEIGY